jgi:hypothetical protein
MGDGDDPFRSTGAGRLAEGRGPFRARMRRFVALVEGAVARLRFRLLDSDTRGVARTAAAVPHRDQLDLEALQCEEP